MSQRMTPGRSRLLMLRVYCPDEQRNLAVGARPRERNPQSGQPRSGDGEHHTTLRRRSAAVPTGDVLKIRGVVRDESQVVYQRDRRIERNDEPGRLGGDTATCSGTPFARLVIGKTTTSPPGPCLKRSTDTTTAGRVPACSWPRTGARLTSHTCHGRLAKGSFGNKGSGNKGSGVFV